MHAASPILIGHRGGVVGVPENSLPAFTRALQYTHFIETDVHFTHDHVPVILHDRTLDRTTDCGGLISDHVWSQVRHCHLHTPFPCMTTRHNPPSLRSVLQIGRLRSAEWIIEIKAYDPEGIDRVWQLIRGMHTIRLASFDPEILRYLYEHHHARNLYLVSHALPHTIPDFIHGLILGSCSVDRKVLRRIKPHYRIFVWTVDDPKEFRRVRCLPIDGIITNRLRYFSTHT
jgi:glycerophosphoryl diester phosphodiesterase